MRPTLAATLLGFASAGAAPVISELMYHPPHVDGRENVLAEWIELHNPGRSTVVLTNWQITAGVSFTFPEVSIPPGQYLVVAADLATFQARHPGIGNVVGGWSGKLSNRAEAIRLADDAGVEVDAVRYADEGDWAVRRPGPDDQGHRGWVWECPADGGGSSLELRNPTLSNSSGQNWLPSRAPLGTPGTQNSVFSLNVPPLIENVSHHPPVPTPTDLVLVQARLTDDLTTPAGLVHYRVSTAAPGPYRSTSLRDDGLGGDAIPKDGIYSAVLPAQPDGAVVEFYLEAFDATQKRTWPGPTHQAGFQGANLLYQVDSEIHTGREPLYRLIFSTPESNEFNRIPLDRIERQTNAQFNTTFIAQQGEQVTTIYRGGTRLRGTGSRSRFPRSLKLRLPSSASWQGHNEFDLNSQYSFNQLLGSLFYREAGLPASQTKAVQVRLNGSNPASRENAPDNNSFARHYGLYVHNEPINSGFAENHFPLDSAGNLYRKTGTGNSWEYFPDSVELAADYSGAGWDKQNNSAANDWTDLHRFIGVMTNATGPDYLEQVEAVLNLDAWLRTLAVSTILTNAENSIFTGRNDDLAIYGGSDGRFHLLPHDLDTILGQGDNSRIEITDLPHTLFDFVADGDSLAQLEPLFQQPAVIQRYYRILAGLLEGPFREDRANALIDRALTWTPAALAANFKKFLAARRADILNQIQPSLAATTDLPMIAGIPRTMTGEADLTGRFNALEADSVHLNGSPASLDLRASAWSFQLSGLNPGINRVVIEERDSSGATLATSFQDLLYDDGDTSETGGLLAADLTLDAPGGPYLVTSSFIVPAGLTLTIEPGTSLYFNPGTGVEILPGGRLVCAGTDHNRIRLTRPPGTNGTWEGILLSAPAGGDSLTDNVISFTDQEYGDDQGSALVVKRSRLTLEHLTWEHGTGPVLDLESPQIEIAHCRFPSIPSSEVIRGSTLLDDDYLILRENVFAPSSSDHAIIRFSGGRRPGPILAAYDNLFRGATDDYFDFDDADAHLEGNVFTNVYPVQPRESTSSAIVADANSHLTVVRNLFHNVDHALLLINASDCLFEHNTVVSARVAALSFDEPLQAGVLPGERIDMDSNLFVDCAAIFAHTDSVAPEPDPIIIGHRNVLPAAHLGIGVENIDLDPYLAHQDAGPWPPSNWALLPGSPAIGTGRNGLDRGALVPRGANLSGVPAPVTDSNFATLIVRGPGITHYRWRLLTDDLPGPWSSDTLFNTPILLRNLQLGTYRLELLARDTAGIWQDPGESTFSPAWSVVAAVPGSVRLNEIFARSAPDADAVEIHNGTDTLIDLGGWFLTDDPEKPTKNPLSGTINPGACKFFSGASVPGLDADGDTLYLYDGPTLIDSVPWGTQAPGFSIGRVGPESTWTLTIPTFGFPNQPAGTAPARNLKINEWLASYRARYANEFVELYNPGDSPAALGGLWISDSPDLPRRFQIPPLTFVPPKGFFLLHASSEPVEDSDDSDDLNQLPFSFDAFYEAIVLSDSDGSRIDQVHLACLRPDLPEGRNPDGSDHIQTFELGTPGSSNNRDRSQRIVRPLIPFESDPWTYLDNAIPGSDWSQPGFNEAGWKRGPAPLGRETSQLPVPLATSPTSDPAFDYTLGRKNYYFRRTFDYDGDPARTALSISTYLDDGAIFYLNGEEVFRHNMPPGRVTASTWASETVGDAGFEGPFPIPSDHLHNGANTLAVITFQATFNSSDIVFDCELTALESIPATPNPAELRIRQLLDYLRITEVMYNPPDGRDAEFIELQNISDTVTLDLTGVRLTEGISYTFLPALLGPGEHIVVVKNHTMFRIVHGNGARVAGEYDSKLHNESEVIGLALPEPREMHIQLFTYFNTWYRETDSFGRSLELIDPTRPLSSWNDPTSWIASLDIHGSPGFANSASKFASWAAALGTGTGDTDRDSLGDPLEYALRLDARNPKVFPVLYSLELAPTGLVSTFLHPALAPPDAIFHLQSSLDFDSWTTHATRLGNGPWRGTVPVEAVLPPTNRGLGLVTLRLPRSPPHRFTRLQVEITDP